MNALKRLNAWIDNAALRDVDGRLYISQIEEPDADTTIEWATTPGRPGQRLLWRTRQAKRVRVEFDIRELFDLRARAAIVTAANGWAKDGILKVSYRPDQRLRVMLAKAAAIDGARDVSTTYAIEFISAGVPYWEDDLPTGITLSGSSGSGTLNVPGQAKTWAKISVTPSSATLNALSLTIDGQTMSFESLAVASGTALLIDHDDRGLLTVTAGSASKLSKRAASSVDDIWIAPGARAVSYTTNTACSVAITVRGRYL